MEQQFRFYRRRPGRPPRVQQGKTARVVVDLPFDLAQALDRICAQNGMPRRWAIASALRDWLPPADAADPSDADE